MTRTLILPGLHDSDPGHWQSRWEARDDTLLRVIQDDWETPHCADWIAKLDQALALTGPDTVLVAHSAGCALVAHWAVGEFSLLRLQFRTIVVASSNDPYVTLSRARAFAMAWGSEFMMIGEAGHINSASGLGDWPEGLELLNTLRKAQNNSEATKATVLA